MSTSAAAVSGLLVAAAIAAEAAPQVRSVWSGVFSAAQSGRGKASFEVNCGRCHNNALVGSQSGPPLKGQAFWRHWEGDTLGSLFVMIRDSMPNDTIESVSDSEKLDILTHILASNGVPAGNDDLTLDREVLDRVALTKDAATPAAIGNFWPVRVVGCLARAGGERWLLSHASEPVVAPNGLVEVADSSDADARQLGALTFTLFGVRSISAESEGRIAHARGVSLRRPGDDRLSVTSLHVTEHRCPL